MAEIHHFEHGWLNPALAYVMAVLGCLVGLLHATKARTRSGRRRVRLLLFATVAMGGAGVWQVHFIALLGFSVPDSVMRYDPKLLAASLGIALVVVGCGLFTAGFGALRGGRLFLAGVLIGLGIAAMHYTGLSALRVGGTVDYEPRRFAAAVGLAIVAATAALWFVSVLRGLTATVLAAMVMGAAICGMHYTAMSAVRVRLGLEHPPIVGVDPMMMVAPIVLFSGAALSMLAFFTFGASTVRDLRLIYEQSGELSEPIEPWMIEEVLARTSRPPMALPAGGPASHRAPRPRIDRALRRNVVWGGTPVWGGRAGMAVAAARPPATRPALPRPTLPRPALPRPASSPAPSALTPAALAPASLVRATAQVPRAVDPREADPRGDRGPDLRPDLRSDLRGDQRGRARRAILAITPARYPPNDPGWDCPGVIGARAPEYHGSRRI